MANSGSFNTSNYDGRYLTFSWSVKSQSTANNQTVISWSLKGAGGTTTSWYMSGNFKVVINGTTVYSSSTRIELYNGTTVASGNFTINHNTDGTKTFSASAQAGIYYYDVNCTGSGSWALPTIPRGAMITNAPNFTDEQNPTITYNNILGNAVTSCEACISLDNHADNVPYRAIPKTGTSYTFNLTEAERNTLRNATPNSNTLTVYFYIKTVYSGNTIYSQVQKTMTIVNANPTGSLSYQDSNTKTVNITKNAQIIIRNNSTLQFIFSSLTALKGAKLAKATATINGVSKSTSLSTTTASIDIVMGTVDSASDLTATLTVTDTRGNTLTSNMTVTMADWVLPSAIITCQRKNNFYTETDLNVDGSISSINGKNVMTITYRYQQSGSSTWSSSATLQDNVTTTISLDNKFAWTVQVVVTDLLGSTTYNLPIDKGIPIIFFDRLLRSVGINTFPQNENSFEVGGNSNTRLLSGGVEIPKSVDLNSYTTVGNYYCPLIATAKTLSNCPTTEAFTMKVYYGTGTESYITQEITIYTAPFTTYSRNFVVYNNQWSNWFMTSGGNMFYQATGTASSQSTTSETITQVQLASVTASSGTIFSIASGGIKVLTSGAYKISGSVYVARTSSSGSSGAYIRVGSAFSSATNINGTLTSLQGGHAIQLIPKIVNLSANQIVYLAGRTRSSAGTISPSNSETYLLVEKVG